MLRALLIVFFSVILLGVGAILAFNMGLFHEHVQAQVAAAAEAKVQLGRVRLLYRWPIKIIVGPSFIDHKLADVRFAQLDVELARVTPPYWAKVRLLEPKVRMKTAQASAPQGAAKSSPPTKSPSQPPALTLEIQRGELDTPFGKVSSLQLEFEQRALLKSAAKLRFQANVTPAALPVPLPVRIESDSLTLSEEAIKSTDLRATVGGLNAKVSGTSLLTEMRHRWLLDVNVPDLSRLPKPPMDLPAKNWKGAVVLRAELIKGGANKPWQAEGEARLASLTADADYQKESVKIVGPVNASASVKFSYLDERVAVKNLSASVGLSAARVEYDRLLAKAAGVAFEARVEGKGDEAGFDISGLEVKLWDIVAKVSGKIEPKSPFNASLRASLAPVGLAGAEKLLVPLRASPVRGQLAVEARLDGPLSDPLASGQVRIDSLKLKGFAATADFDKPGVFQIRGPVSADLEGKGELDRGRVKAAEGRGFAELGAAALTAGPLRKEAGAKMNARFALRNQGETVLFDQFELSSFFGTIGMKGKVERPLSPKVDLALSLRPLDVSELRIAMPEYRDKLPKGKITADLKLLGVVDLAKGWHDWPLKVTGWVNANLPEYKSAPESAQPAPAPGAPPSAPEATAGFLPKGELTNSASIGVRANVETVQMGALELKGVAFNGKYTRGMLSGVVNIREVFEGTLGVSQLSLPLLTVKPTIQGTAVWKNIDLQRAIAFSKPEYKEFASGRTQGTAEFSTRMPSEPDFMNALKTRGEMILAPVTFNTIKIGQMINDLLKKVPMIKTTPAKVEPLKGTMKLSFELAAGALALPSVLAQDLDGSEIALKGNLVLSTFRGDFVGTFAWANPQVKGCLLEGNADAKGRMVIPLAIKGDLMSPGVGMLSDLAGKLAGKALECEKNKLVDKAKTEGKKRLEQEIKKGLDKTLKGILGR